MTTATQQTSPSVRAHKQLPDKDGVPVRNSLEPYQSALLTDSLLPLLRQQYPNGDYFIGQDCGLYWRQTVPPAAGCKAPDWYFIPEVPGLLDGEMRRSYVLWEEVESPLIILEYASGNGDEERDYTPRQGKLWVYERGLHSPFYGIYFAEPGLIEMRELVGNRYRPMPPNGHGRFPIPQLGVELGLWTGDYEGFTLPWMRWWGPDGDVLPTGREAEEAQRLKAERLAARLRELGEDPEQF